MFQPLRLSTRVPNHCRGKDEDLRAVQKLLLQAVVAFALRELFVGELAVERDDPRPKLLELLGQDDAAFGKILSSEFFYRFSRTLHQVGEADAELNYAAIVRVVKRLRHHATLMQSRPEKIASSGVVVAGAHGRLRGIAAHDYELHAFTKIVGESFHFSSALTEK